MTNPIHATTQESGRFYTHPTTGEKFWSVSTILKALNKPFLIPWAAKEAGLCADREWAKLSEMKSVERIHRIKSASSRIANRSSAKGSQVHAIIEEWIRTGCPEDFDIRSAPRVSDLQKWNEAGEDIITLGELKPYHEGFVKWAHDFEVEFLHSETTVWSRTEKYAGTLDIIARIHALKDAPVAILDAKSGKAIYPEAAPQLAAYARAEFYVAADGTEQPLPACSAAFGLHVTANGSKLLPIVVDDSIYASFLYIREAFRFQEVYAKTVIGPEIKPVLKARV